MDGKLGRPQSLSEHGGEKLPATNRILAMQPTA
jgi:hypothetical protein